jgi:dipeptidyl aminopeptidase/acylaminoacyl peptidase
MKNYLCIVLLSCVGWVSNLIAAPLFSFADYDRLTTIAEPAFSPDGDYLLYSLSSNNLEKDMVQSDLWRVRWRDGQTTALTQTPESSEWLPRWSPDGSGLAFLSDRGSETQSTQIWFMPAFGGEARQLTDFPGGVEDFVWSPDGSQLALIALDPPLSKNDAATAGSAPPIVTRRFYFKEDGAGYLTEQRRHLYLFSLEKEMATALTSGQVDADLPSWSPDGRQIAFVTKRGPDPDRHLNFDIYVIEARAGGRERQLTQFSGPDASPDQAARPAWSPDSQRIAYLQGGETKWIDYAPQQLAVVEVASGKSSVVAALDRSFQQPRWSLDGRSLYALIEDNRVTHLARIDLRNSKITYLTRGAEFYTDYALGAKGRIAALGGDVSRPYELRALTGKKWRALSTHDSFLSDRQLAQVEPLSVASTDGVRIDGFLVKPPGFQAGRRYPLIVNLHGGPVYQFSYEFMPDWQLYAASGYMVMALNPRGSSGRGFDFARTIYADWGNKDVKDIHAGVDYLIAQGSVDSQRLAVGGWSYGGILTNYLIASDNRFAAAVSGAGIAHFIAAYGHDQYTLAYESELGKPWENPELYNRLSYPFLKADRIKTPTAFQCANLDYNVPCLGSEQMYQALRSLNVPSELVIYQEQGHSLSVPSDRRDSIQRELAWYARFLDRLPQPVK